MVPLPGEAERNGTPQAWAEGPSPGSAGEPLAPGIQPSYGCVMCCLFAAWSGNQKERLTPHPLLRFGATPSPRYRAPNLVTRDT